MEDQIRRVSLSDQVVEAVLRLISENGLTVGDRLPATAELSQSFGVSRTVVREALAELTGRGLLKKQQGKEGVVSVPGSEHLRRLFDARLEQESFDLIHVHELREALETRAAELAAERASREDVLAIRECLDRLISADSVDHRHEADLRFHQAIAEASHNSLLAFVLDALAPLLHKSRQDAWSGYIDTGGTLDKVFERHTLICQAIENRNPAGAAAAMTADLTDSRQALLSREGPPP